MRIRSPNATWNVDLLPQENRCPTIIVCKSHIAKTILNVIPELKKEALFCEWKPIALDKSRWDKKIHTYFDEGKTHIEYEEDDEMAETENKKKVEAEADAATAATTNAAEPSDAR